VNLGRRPSRQARAGATGEAGPGILVFLHLPKTAGTTLMHVLEREYGRDSILNLYESQYGDEVAALGKDDLDRTRVIAGHFYFGLHTHVSRPCHYFTFLRDPVKRVISHYRFVRRQPTHYLYPAASSMTVAEYVEFCDAAEPNNDQTRLLAGKEMASDEGACSADMLPVAKRNLDRHAAVGVTEAFDLSLLLIRRIFGWSVPFYARQNVDTRARGESLPAGVREVIRRYNELDIELYRYGRERFERDVAEQGDTLTRELRAFRKVNAVYAAAQRLTSASARRYWMVRA
jgi:hypothetical protein